ncbi:MAG: biotin carboxylase N-terminal domain-containing protein [Armatimonadota bacterium]|nr:biotin carboxylase N-terminal domain-containing protein [Armatimonadota bacterium]MDR7464536.1 biotin carboxylase N-terminal domain-containing protein [Armatimonadota bacterium]MDR7469003.1 biotin carboxylase N-terminal domain-containing protein [Armatimonadota bacterium]MDR7474050.1 biotin carboxylase N-terminal domain-containing protein [Armatimonadota bacterium]MDR7538044.1 biotin carboxylase N-terminal domain-containing protein [Armatimonadota bacterium]
MRIRRLLIANRGEIAVRIIRACRALGVVPLAVFSPVDRSAPHVRLAAEAWPLPGDSPAESYLNIPRLLEIARAAEADALHPGYGFLAENPAFAAACAAAGVIFVGPPAEVLARCGDKVTARQRIAAAGVPVLPGTGAVDDREAIAAADVVGYPLLIKAVGGGGGKGIHLVESAADLPSALRLARGEAVAAFGDPRLYLERWLDRPRHVEVQVLADARGEVVHLGERECSVQRRHQKVIEESPAPALTPALRDRLGMAAVAAARAVGYVNAGTVEFLLDGEAFYCIEVNARLQVEHPVTEMVTGVDLVEAQLRIAGGEPLWLGQDQVVLRGHAIECRVGAEDPHHGFLPSLGVIVEVREPAGPGVRVDSGLVPGLPVSRYYDPLLAKVITWGPSRSTALDRMAAALDEMAVSGVRTTLPFLRWAVRDPAFRAGAYDIRFAQRWDRRLDEQPPDREAQEVSVIAASLWTHQRLRARARRQVPADGWQRVARLEALRGGM